MRKISYLSIWIISFFLYGSGALYASKEVTLHPYAEITDKVIRLKDVFSYQGPYENHIIANAPNVGQQITLPGEWLFRIAQKYQIYWAAASKQDYVVVKRLGKHIDAEILQDIILEHVESLEQLENDQKIDIELNTTHQNGVWIPLDAEDGFAITSFSLRGQKRYFDANIKLGTHHGKALYKRVKGTINISQKAWVLANSVNRGHIITQNDLTHVWIKKRNIQDKNIISKEAIIGKQAHRRIAAGKPISEYQIREPILIESKQLVTVKYQYDNLLLTLQAQSLDEGSKGDVIRIMNLDSKKIFQAVVVGTGVASINYQSSNL